jgi:hypothetical protein
MNRRPAARRPTAAARQLRDRVTAALGVLFAEGRAVGFHVVAGTPRGSRSRSSRQPALALTAVHSRPARESPDDAPRPNRTASDRMFTSSDAGRPPAVPWIRE